MLSKDRIFSQFSFMSSYMLPISLDPIFRTLKKVLHTQKTTTMTTNEIYAPPPPTPLPFLVLSYLGVAI